MYVIIYSITSQEICYVLLKTANTVYTHSIIYLTRLTISPISNEVKLWKLLVLCWTAEVAIFRGRMRFPSANHINL